MKWLLDTDTCIALIRHRTPEVLRKLRSRAVGQVGISTITLSEFAYGVARSGRPAENASALGEFLLSLEIAPYDEAAAKAYGSLRATLEARGSPIGPLDTQIAAHALALDAILVTHNRREFDRVPGLRVDDWMNRRPGGH